MLAFQVASVSLAFTLVVYTLFRSCYGNPTSARCILKDISHVLGWLLCDDKGFSRFPPPRGGGVSTSPEQPAAGRAAAGCWEGSDNTGLFSLAPSGALHHGLQAWRLWRSGALLAARPPPTGRPGPIRGTSSLTTVTRRAASPGRDLPRPSPSPQDSELGKRASLARPG